MSFPIKALLSFSAPGVNSKLASADKGFNKLENSIKTAGQQLKSIGAGLKSATVATAPLIAGVALSVKAFSDFESQMSTVRSLTGNITEKQFAAMGAEAKRLGATTAFTAKEAAEGFEFLALAGFKAEEQVGSLETVLNLAAAGSLDLGRASDILTDSMSALAPAIDQNAGKVKNLSMLSDQFAFIQSKTNTNIEQLGEAVKFGGGALAGFGFKLPNIIASMGALANAGLKGSLGGTSLMNMFNKLLKPSGKAQEFLDRYNVSLTDSEGKMKSIPDIMDSLVVGLEDISNEQERSAMAMELFGVRGIRAYNAMKNEGTDSMRILAEGVKNSTGTAARQAEERLNNLKGGFTKFFSAVSGVMIELGGIVGEHIRAPVEKAGKVLSMLAIGFQLATGSIGETSKSGEIFFKTLGPERGQQVLDFLSGFIEGINSAVTFLSGLVAQGRDFISQYLGVNESFGNTGKLVGQIGAALVIVMPIIATIGVGLMVIGPILFGILQTFGLMITAVKIVGFILALVFSPIGLMLLAITAVGAAVFFLTGQTFGFWDAIKAVGTLLLTAWESPIESAIAAFWAVDKVVGDIFESIKIGAKALGFFLFDVISSPIIGIWNLIKGLIGKLANTTLGKIALKISGIEVGALQEFLKETPNTAFERLTGGKPIETPTISKNLNKVGDIAALQTRSIEQKAIGAPASSQMLHKEIMNATLQPEVINVVSKLYLDGREVAISTAKHKIENNERSGKFLSPIEKRRLIENG